MTKPKYKPLQTGATALSEEKRSWWDQLWRVSGLKQSRKVVFQHAMNTTARPTHPGESVEYGYVSNLKFLNYEMTAVVEKILALDSRFFETYPRRKNTKFGMNFMRAVVGEAARAFYRHGLTTYGKPELRKQPLSGL